VVLPELGVASTIKPSLPEYTDIFSDLSGFDRYYDLPAATLQVVSTLDASAAPELAIPEEVQDVEIVHTVAPEATIRILLLPSVTQRWLTTGVSSAVSEGDVMSFSLADPEQCLTHPQVVQLNDALVNAESHNVTVVAASGDTGTAVQPCASSSSTAFVKGLSLPASDPLVLAVGGTSLTANVTTGSYQSETAWNTVVGSGIQEASGGGLSQLFATPNYQGGLRALGGHRGVPDVAADASPLTGMGRIFSSSTGQYEFLLTRGTSASAPLWAGLIALADQEAGRDLGFVNPGIYSIAGSASYHKAFHDVTTGDNSVTLLGTYFPGYNAAPGWDPVTGWGTPDAQYLVPLLAGYAGH
jgi:subtilase family serine protease